MSKKAVRKPKAKPPETIEHPPQADRQPSPQQAMVPLQNAAEAGFGVPDLNRRASGIAAVQAREIADSTNALAAAKKYPRDEMRAVDRIIQACTRPGLAEKALYTYVRGGSEVTGPSIRLAEAIAQQWGNMNARVIEISRHEGSSEVMAVAWDFESNFQDMKIFTVKHWRDTKAGGYAVTEERDIYEVIANMGARRKRACMLAVIPGDIVEMAVRQCEATLMNTQQVTPERVKKMLETFAEYKVTQAMIEKRIGRRIEALTPALMVNLGKIANSLRDGMSKPDNWFGDKLAPPVDPSEEVSATEPKRDDFKKPPPKQEPKAAEAPPKQEIDAVRDGSFSASTGQAEGGDTGSVSKPPPAPPQPHLSAAKWSQYAGAFHTDLENCTTTGALAGLIERSSGDLAACEREAPEIREQLRSAVIAKAESLRRK